MALSRAPSILKESTNANSAAAFAQEIDVQQANLNGPVNSVRILAINARHRALYLEEHLSNCRGWRSLAAQSYAQGERPKMQKPRPVAMNAEQVQAFLDAASRRPEGLCSRSPTSRAVGRASTRLKWSDWDKKAHTIALLRSLKWRKKGGVYYEVPPKTEKGYRTISLIPEIERGLEQERKRQLELKLRNGSLWSDTGFIFTREDGQPMKLSHALGASANPERRRTAVQLQTEGGGNDD